MSDLGLGARLLPVIRRSSKCIYNLPNTSTRPPQQTLTTLTTLTTLPHHAPATTPSRAAHGAQRTAEPLTTLPTDPLHARELQVAKLNATSPATRAKAPRIPWPEPDPKTLTNWLARHPAETTYSPAHMDAQRRLLWLATVAPESRWEAFERECHKRTLAPTTASTYWQTWLSCQRILCLPAASGDQRATKLLKARATQYPVAFPLPLTAAMMLELRHRFIQDHPLVTTMIGLAWTQGQRLGDVAQVAVADVTATKKYCQITIRRGKTVTICQPYTLFVPLGRFPAQELLILATEASREGRLFLTSRNNETTERDAFAHSAATLLSLIDDRLELRSVRRGGLQHMANAGYPMETLLLFSKHRDQSMLLRYLNWGAESADHAKTMGEVTRTMTAAIEPPPRPTNGGWTARTATN